MRLRKTATKSVNPAVAAILIAATIGAVQYIWWVKLVAKHPQPHGGPNMSGGGGAGPSIPTVLGLKSVKVDTLAGDPEPGFADGPGHSARFDAPTGIAVDGRGSVVVTDTRNNRIRLISSPGHTDTLAGGEAGFRDGTAAEARFSGPSGVAVGPDGAIYVADTGNSRIRRILNGNVTTAAGGEAGFADGPASSARFNLPTTLALDASSPGAIALLVADSGNRRIRRLRIGPGQATVETVATEPTPPTGVAWSGGSAAVAYPEQGRLSIASRRITRLPIAPGEDSSSFPVGALTVAHPAAVCASGTDWFVTDAVHASVIRVRPSDAQVIAGCAYGIGPRRGFRDGTGELAQFGSLAGIAADGHGHLFVADCSNNAIRRITLPPDGLQ